jgi:hypothetical protein
MNNRFLAEDFRKIAQRLAEIADEDLHDDATETGGADGEEVPDGSPVPDEADAAPEAEGTDGPADTEAVDQSATDLMTQEKKPERLTGGISIQTLAKDLGLTNVKTFNAAFNSLKAGKMPSNSAQVRELAIAFDKLLAADASTTSRILTKLRAIHKAN